MFHLPDEMVLHILSFLDERSLIRCRSVNKQLLRIVHDDLLISKFPNIILQDKRYLKEEAYNRKDLLFIILQNKTNDLQWLISRQTHMLKNIYGPNDKIAWCLAMLSTCKAIETSWNETWNVTQHETWNATQNASWNASWNTAWNTVWNTAWNTAWNQAIIYENTKEYIKSMHLSPYDEITKSYQIYECLFLLVFNEPLYRKMLSIQKQYNLDGQNFNLDLPKDNPWAIQFRDLFGVNVNS